MRSRCCCASTAPARFRSSTSRSSRHERDAAERTERDAAAAAAHRRAPSRSPTWHSPTARLYVAGLSNEEFSSKLRSVPYPFAAVDNGTSVEIFHGSHGQLETRSPVYAFVPYQIERTPYLIAGYLCTPLVKFPVASLKPGSKVRGTTIAELGAGNRPIDMILYKQGRQGIPADVEHQPRRHEDSDRGVRVARRRSRRRVADKAASATKRSRR